MGAVSRMRTALQFANFARTQNLLRPLEIAKQPKRLSRLLYGFACPRNAIILPDPHRLGADINVALGPKVVAFEQAWQKPDTHHHQTSNDLG